MLPPQTQILTQPEKQNRNKTKILEKCATNRNELIKILLFSIHQRIDLINDNDNDIANANDNVD